MYVLKKYKCILHIFFFFFFYTNSRFHLSQFKRYLTHRRLSPVEKRALKKLHHVRECVPFFIDDSARQPMVIGEAKRRREIHGQALLVGRTARTFSRGRGKNLLAGPTFWSLISCIFLRSRTRAERADEMDGGGGGARPREKKIIEDEERYRRRRRGVEARVNSESHRA